ncbi:NAD(P)-dependent alcohol dehydrogenase [Ichthyenterobacterium magnum]|uniref:NADPH:quinone reductase-like Zn-dependent oxidoreductase n=1 Tax=Ichthyenterobacterium magnum TaxID=1230530 RepID=A0A420DM56_9FLAO|nr:NAD(P)-dependent alcohol dehydrogenase [Ichthyenterobacterium magnum]RKE95374.1 NADPH:quinone reductase-like Zn-dependent oxidoreductase [Ichthyenterobacterium magnum]
MKAAIRKKYGSPDVIEIITKDKPIPTSNEILVKIKASAVTRADAMMREGVPKFGRLFLGLTKPKNPSLGTGFSGIIEALGDNIKTLKINDAVFGEVLFGNSANAEYVCVNEDSVIAIKPSNISHQEAAPICDGALTSYSFLKDIGKVTSGQHILINGASGSLGTAAIQLAKILGAKVTAVCSATNFDLVKSLGAGNVIDYKTEDFTKNHNTYDVIYDAVGKSSVSKSKKALTKNGIYMSPVLSFSLLLNTIMSKRAKFSATGMRKPKELKPLLYELSEFIKLGKLKTVIDKEYALEHIIEAHRHVDTGRKKGNVVITLD